MKKVTSLLLLAGVAAFGLVGCGDDIVGPGSIQSVTVTPSDVTIEVGETVTLSANVEGSGDTGVTWTSSAPSVASVDGSGNVTGQSTGTATIRATSNVDDSKSGAAVVTVVEAGGDRPTISILGIECVESIGDCNEPDNIEGDIRVTLNVDEGGQDIASVQLLLNGEVVREQTFSTAIAGLSQQTEGTSNITFVLDTDGAGECTMGEILTPDIPNGLKELQARLILEEGDDETATWDDSLNFDNENRVEVIHVEGTGATAVGGGAANNSTAPEGQRFWGHDFMNMAAVNDTLTFAACPVVFEGDITVGEIRLSGDTDPEADDKDFDVDLGSGHGALQSDDAEPFQYMADPAANDSVEDTEAGHVIGDEVRVFTDEGEDVTDSFTINELTDFWLDFTAPMEESLGSAAIQIDAMDIMARHYSDEAGPFTFKDDSTTSDPDGPPVGDYQITGIIDGGVGVDLSAQPIDVFHDTASAADGTPVAEDRDGLNDADEEGCVVGDGTFCLEEQGDPQDPASTEDPDGYFAQNPELVDLLKNSMTTEGIAALQESPVHGIDRTEPDVEKIDTAPDSGVVIDDTELLFSAVDPDLNNDADPADHGSGVDDFECEELVVGDCNAILAFDADGDRHAVDDNGTDKATDEDFAVQLTGAGLNEGGEETITVSVADSAFKVPNVAELSWTFIFDTTPPTVSFSGVTGLDQSDADFVDFTVEGRVTDRNGDGSAVTSAVINVSLAGVDGVCNTADDVRDPAVLLVEPDTADVTDQVQDPENEDGSYEVVFTAENPGDPDDARIYCFNMEADDGAITADGSDAGHQQARSANKDFTWNPTM